MLLTVNLYGQRKAQKFRQHFNLQLFSDTYQKYGVTEDAHDYLHTCLGVGLGMENEMIVLQYEEDLLTGRKPIPKGCEWLTNGNFA